MISSPNLRIDARGEWFRLKRLSRQRSSASESNLRCSREEWPACIGRRDNNLPRPILFFVAAKKNGSACSGYRTTRSAADSNFFAATENGFACSGSRDDDLPRPILIFVAAKKNGSACRDRIGDDLPRPILIFVAAKKNGSPAVHPQRQPKSRLRLVRCCSDSGFHGVNLGIATGFARVLA